MGKSVKELFKFYKGLGLNVQMKLYKNARHEILNEIDREQVEQDVLNWLSDTLTNNKK